MPELTEMAPVALTGGELIPGLAGADPVGVLAAQLSHLPRGEVLFPRAPYSADLTGTSEVNPGAGNLRWNHATPSSASEIYIADSDSDAASHSASWASLVPGGRLYVQRVGSGGILAQQVWEITSVGDESGYGKFGVTLLAANGLISADDPLQVTLQGPPPPAGDGDVVGPGGSTDNALPRFHGAGGKTLQGSGVLVGDNNEISGYRGHINRQTGTSYTVQASDAGKIIEFANVAAIAVTLPNSLPAGFSFTGVQDAAGAVTFSAASGGTLKNRQSHTKTAGNGAFVALYVSSNSGSNAAWRLGGDTAA